MTLIYNPTYTFIIVSDDNVISELNTGAIIGGAVGGTALSVIICVFCIVLFLMRQLCNNQYSNKQVTKLDSDIEMASNPAYDVTKQSIKEEFYCDYEYSFQDYTQDTIKLDTNPSYGVVPEYNRLGNNSDNAVQSQCSDANQPYPSYRGNSKSSREIYDNQDGCINTDLNGTKGSDYVEILGPTTQEENPTISDVAATNVVSVTNPSYNFMSGGIILEDNPSYDKIIFTQNH